MSSKQRKVKRAKEGILITKSTFNDTCRLKWLKILNLSSLYMFGCLLFDHSSSEKFYSKKPRPHTHISLETYVLFLNIQNIQQPFFFNAPWYSCTIIFNRLPNHIKNDRSSKSYKTLCLSYHLEYFSIVFRSTPLGRLGKNLSKVSGLVHIGLDQHGTQYLNWNLYCCTISIERCLYNSLDIFQALI